MSFTTLIIKLLPSCSYIEGLDGFIFETSSSDIIQHISVLLCPEVLLV